MGAEAVLFDLDGTLADTAPDLLGALDHVRARLGLPALSAGQRQALGRRVGKGARDILLAGLADAADDGAGMEQWIEHFLDHYQHHLWRSSRLYPGIGALLEQLAARDVKMAVVTNKLERFTRPLLERAGIEHFFSGVVCRDGVDKPKPHPEAMLQACRRLGIEPGRAVAIGDDRRDIQAGQAAGCATVVAVWGYLPEGVAPADWGADAIIDHPGELASILAQGFLPGGGLRETD